MKKITNNSPMVLRLYQYQKERFPILGHGLLIAAFTFSAISFSKLSRGVQGFIEYDDFFIGLLNGLAFFLLLRICDEHKDKEDDAEYRAYLPVPRGLVSLNELKVIGIVVGLGQMLSIAIFQTAMLPLYFIVIAYLFLMTKEFFVVEWLKARPVLYTVSHMMIIPFIDLYSSGLDWKLEEAGMHTGIYWFILVSFFNGLVLEIGRKIRIEQDEEVGVVTYSKIYGSRKAVKIWMGLLLATLVTALLALNGLANPDYSMAALVGAFTLCLIPALMFLKTPTTKSSKRIEKISGVWTLIMYLSLGALPIINNLLV